MAKKKIKITFEVTIDEDAYEEIAEGKDFKTFKEEIKKAFTDEVAQGDLKVDIQEVRVDD